MSIDINTLAAKYNLQPKMLKQAIQILDDNEFLTRNQDGGMTSHAYATEKMEPALDEYFDLRDGSVPEDDPLDGSSDWIVPYAVEYPKNGHWPAEDYSFAILDLNHSEIKLLGKYLDKYVY